MTAVPREWRLVDDMVACCGKVLATRRTSTARAVADPMRYDATLRNLELIGEAATTCRQTSVRRPATCPGAC